MRWFILDFSRRATTAELMDDPDLPEADVRAALDDLRRINRYLGVRSTLRRHLFALIRRHRLRTASILDVATGSADIPQALVHHARRKGLAVRLVALDHGQTMMKIARTKLAGDPEISLVQADALALPFPANSFDFAIVSEFLHHLTGEQAAAFLRRLREIVRVAFIIHDLRRHPVAYYGFWLLSRLFFRSRLVRHDGPVSFLRGFTEDDVERLKQESGLDNLALYRHFPYRMVLVGTK